MAKQIFYMIIVIPYFTQFSPAAAEYPGRNQEVLFIEISLKAEITVIGTVRRLINFYS